MRGSLRQRLLRSIVGSVLLSWIPLAGAAEIKAAHIAIDGDCTRISFDVSGQLFADALQQQQQRQAQQLPMTAPIAVPVDAGFTFNDAINEF